jgi:hypothetical protein
MSTQCPALHTINDIVYFQPNLNLIDASTGHNLRPATGIKAKVVGVSFTKSEVLYDLALDGYATVNGELQFNELHPIRSVDSSMVCPSVTT